MNEQQTGQGWAEPPEQEDGVEQTHPTKDNTLPALSGRYTKRCRYCNRQPVHEDNTLELCSDCAAKIAGEMRRGGTLNG